ncbi:MAG TPA: hypothetical protein VHY20_03550, partial [Pirellulales bacterium]|nr:hypothetical protein [Pirellulales bacterium]
FHDLEVRVFFGETLTAEADFTDDAGKIIPQNLLVQREFRRRGLGDAIYGFAECALNGVMVDFWNGLDQSPDAAAHWNRPNRPWGNRQNS